MESHQRRPLSEMLVIGNPPDLPPVLPFVSLEWKGREQPRISSVRASVFSDPPAEFHIPSHPNEAPAAFLNRVGFFCPKDLYSMIKKEETVTESRQRRSTLKARKPRREQLNAWGFMGNKKKKPKNAEVSNVTDLRTGLTGKYGRKAIKAYVVARSLELARTATIHDIPQHTSHPSNISPNKSIVRTLQPQSEKLKLLTRKSLHGIHVTIPIEGPRRSTVGLRLSLDLSHCRPTKLEPALISAAPSDAQVAFQLAAHRTSLSKPYPPPEEASVQASTQVKETEKTATPHQPPAPAPSEAPKIIEPKPSEPLKQMKQIAIPTRQPMRVKVSTQFHPYLKLLKPTTKPPVLPSLDLNYPASRVGFREIDDIPQEYMLRLSTLEAK